MMRGLLALLLCLVLGTPSWAASGVEALRAEAQAARGQVRGLRERQQSLRAELNTLAGHIEALKARRQGLLVAGAELESALRRSQELSGDLTGLAQSLAEAETDAERRNLALHTALSEELARVRAAWDATGDREARAGLIARMRSLRAERDAVRAALPASQVPALDAAQASDDPEDLLEQADALRDSEDKVREHLQALRTRISEVREERELDRRMRDFLGEESMFDEQDRRMRLRKTPGSSRLTVEPVQRAQPGLRFNAPAADGETGNVSSPAPPAAGQPPEGPYTPPPLPVSASDSRPQVGTVRAQALAGGNLDDLRSLEAEAARLESLAGELDSRADALENRAHSLR